MSTSREDNHEIRKLIDERRGEGTADKLLDKAGVTGKASVYQNPTLAVEVGRLLGHAEAKQSNPTVTQGGKSEPKADAGASENASAPKAEPKQKPELKGRARAKAGIKKSLEAGKTEAVSADRHQAPVGEPKKGRDRAKAAMRKNSAVAKEIEREKGRK